MHVCMQGAVQRFKRRLRAAWASRGSCYVGDTVGRRKLHVHVPEREGGKDVAAKWSISVREPAAAEAGKFSCDAICTHQLARYNSGMEFRCL